ncbi:MAG: 2-hydroxyacyl-CoA dehydratase [Chloroflexi bacterium]|nr:2-hydroxyacyl-CoA dehydratase [Chloroflexota bacterium]
MQSQARESQRKGLEELIKGVARRIKQIEESAGPTVVSADKLLLELTKERLEAQLDAWQRGRPSVDGNGALGRFFRSMGFTPTIYSKTYEYCAPSFGEQKAICERMGFPADKVCEKIVAQLAIRESDTLPKPDVVFVDSHGCDNDHKYYARSYSDLFNIPAFFVDIPLYEDDNPTLASLNYIADQFGEFIDWAESKFPGVKYNEGRHREMLEIDAIGLKYNRELYQLAKRIPCPFSPRDILTRLYTGALPSLYPNMEKAVEYLRVFRDTVGERVASGTGPYPEERLRLLWSGTSHGFQRGDGQTIDPCKLLLERKVALPLALVGHTSLYIGLVGAPIGDVAEYGVKLSPLQEEAKQMATSCWGGPGKRWVNTSLKGARDTGAHGIIHYQLIGCTPMRGMGSVLAERAEKELGIPTLNIEGQYLDRVYMSQEQFEETLAPFIDKCFDWAGKPRQ